MIFSRETGMESSNMESISEESMDSLVEAFIYDDISRRPDALREEAINSPEMEALLERGKFKKNTLVRLNRNDDLERRIGMAAIQMAKEHNDPLYEKLKKNRIKERELLNAIDKKYYRQATKAAKAAQVSFIKQKPKTGYVPATQKSGKL